MNIQLLTDLIKDDQGNYYVAVSQEDDHITLVNALLERSYRKVMEFTDSFRERFAAYDGQYIGKIAADDLRHDVVFAIQQLDQTQMYTLEEVERRYRIRYIDTIEFYRNPKADRHY